MSKRKQPENVADWEFPKPLEIVKCTEGNKEYMKERRARHYRNTVLVCEYFLDLEAATEPRAKLITWRLAKRAARDFLRSSIIPVAVVTAHPGRAGGFTIRVTGAYGK